MGAAGAEWWLILSAVTYLKNKRRRPVGERQDTMNLYFSQNIDSQESVGGFTYVLSGAN